MTTVLRASPRGFVNTPAVEQVAVRALRYLQSGFSVHLRGPAGTGKTTLALHLADLLARPIMLIFGDDELKTSDMIGNQAGYTRKKVVDNYIHSVVKVEDELRQNWIDSRLTLAAKEGFTLVYDEFNRSRPEVNNVLLSVLEEKLLILPPNRQRSEYVRVHSQFRAIFTSNPAEYCGVHATQDALLDRLVTIDMAGQDEQTQTEILVQKTGIDRQEGLAIVQVVKAFCDRAIAHLYRKDDGTKGGKHSSSMRACLTIAKVCHEHNIPVMPENREFRDVCADVLLSRSNLDAGTATELLCTSIDELSTLRGEVSSVSDNVVVPDLFSVENELIRTDSQLHPQTAKLRDRDLGLPYESEIYAYLQQFESLRVSEIQTALGINRVQTIDALRSLLKQGVLMQRDDRLYVAQRNNVS